MKKIVFIFAFLSALFSTTANADCLGIAKGIASSCLVVKGGEKAEKLFEQNQNCLQRRIDDIAHAWQEFNMAVDINDTNMLQTSAGKVRFQTQVRNEMFASCWNTIKANCKLAGNTVDDAISAISTNTCSL